MQVPNGTSRASPSTAVRPPKRLTMPFTRIASAIEREDRCAGQKSSMKVAVWLGVDVGGRRKGFDVALVDEGRLVDLRGRLGRDAVVELGAATRPALVASDSPCPCAPGGQKTR